MQPLAQRRGKTWQTRDIDRHCSMRRLSPLPVVMAVFATFSCLALAGTPSKAEPETGLEGVISISPIHGGPLRQGMPDSKPLANTEFFVKRENATVASFKTDDLGRFRISLPPGHYTVAKKNGEAAVGNYSFEVDVLAGKMKVVQWDCDTGIR